MDRRAEAIKQIVSVQYEHTVEELLGQRLYAMCLGYEDLNEQLRAKNAPQSVVMIASASSRFLF